MYALEPRITVKIKFKAMDEPVEVAVPWNVLPYLDMHTDRVLTADGAIVYERPQPDPHQAARAAA